MKSLIYVGIVSILAALTRVLMEMSNIVASEHYVAIGMFFGYIAGVITEGSRR